MDALLNKITSYHNDDKKIYSSWVEQASKFIPFIDATIHNKLPNGCYIVTWERENYCLTPYTIKHDTFYIKDDTTQKVLTEINNFFSKRKLYENYDLIHKRGILLQGKAGCGKSTLVNTIIENVTKYDVLTFIVKNYDNFILLSSCLPEVIKKIEPDRSIIIIIEDVDKLLEENAYNESRLLNFLDGFGSIDNQLTIMTTNNTTDLSEAFLRPSRIDTQIVINEPSSSIREEYFKAKNIKEDELKEYVNKTENMSFAQLKEVLIGTKILNKSLDDVVKQLNTSTEDKNYLNTKNLGYGFN